MTREELFVTLGDNPQAIDAILNRFAFPRVEQELAFMKRNNVTALGHTDPEYPQRLNEPECADTPTVLYYMGHADLNSPQSIAIVGSRRATEYGKAMAEKIVSLLPSDGPSVISGLAWGIDTASHKAAVNNDIPTVGVLGHGFDQIYPSANKSLARKMVDGCGALVTEYPGFTQMNPRFFPARNRIIAALSDLTIVVEAAESSGALITARYASGYHRKVFAIPGRAFDTYSVGCNALIAHHNAEIFSSVEDLFRQMNWNYTGHSSPYAMSPDELQLWNILNCENGLTLDDLIHNHGLKPQKIAALLLTMEIGGLIKCLPGGRYKSI